MEYLRNIGKKLVPYMVGLSVLHGATTAYADSPAEKSGKWLWRGPAMSLVELFITPLKAIEKHGLGGKALVEGTFGALSNSGSRLSAATLDATVCSLDETPLYSRNGEVIELGKDSAFKSNVINAVAEPFKAD